MSSNPLIRFLSLLVFSLFAGFAVAAPDRGDSSEREKIERERNRIEAVHAEQQRQCLEKFAVTSCADQAKRTRRTALAELRRRSATLDEAQRKQRAERRRQDINAKTARSEALAREPAVRAPRQTPEMAPRASREPATPPVARLSPATREAAKAAPAAPAPKPERPGPTSAAASAAADAARQAQEAKSRADFEARRQAAQEHLREVMERNAQRAASRAAAAPLPPPGASKP